MELKSNHLVEPIETTEIPWVAQLVAIQVVVLKGALRAVEHNGLDMTSVTKQVAHAAIKTKFLILEFPSAEELIQEHINTLNTLKLLTNTLTGLAFFIGPQWNSGIVFKELNLKINLLFSISVLYSNCISIMPDINDTQETPADSLSSISTTLPKRTQYHDKMWNPPHIFFMQLYHIAGNY